MLRKLLRPTDLTRVLILSIHESIEKFDMVCKNKDFMLVAH